jgi:aminocarboxymuconate-semialdehyde decarboxylase
MVIDVHAHAIVPAAMGLVSSEPGGLEDRARESQLLGEQSAAVQVKLLNRVGPLLANLEARLAAMDHQGVDMQLVSPSPAHYCDWADESVARRVADTVNEGIADLVAAAPQRLQGLGLAPLHVAEEALVSSVSDLGLRGVEISTSGRDGLELGDAALEPPWAKAAELEGIIFVHPWGCSLDERLDRHYLRNIVGQNVEHAVVISHLIFSGVLDRHPDVRIVFAHGSGYVPFQAARMDPGWKVREEATTPRRPRPVTCAHCGSTPWSMSPSCSSSLPDESVLTASYWVPTSHSTWASRTPSDTSASPF